MIPKKIHYCWFGKKTIPKKDQKCIASWKKFCPDYEIIEWNEQNYDVTLNAYMEVAYNERKWGFVPDYARFDIIYRYGGFYLDTDVELLKSLDELRVNSAYIGFESEIWLSGGVGFGAVQNNPVIKELRDMYKNKKFKNEDGTLNLTPSPHYITELFVKKGLKRNNQLQIIDGITIYPTDYFGAKDYYTGKINKTVRTISIHHYNASWKTPHQRRMLKVRRLLGNENYNRLVDFKNRFLKGNNEDE